MYIQVWYGAIMNLYNLPTYLTYTNSYINKHMYIPTYLPPSLPPSLPNYFHGEHPLLKSFMPQLVTKFHAL